MTKRQVIINQLREYFAAKGGVMTVDEYKAAEDAPIRLQALKRAVGPWSRVVAMIEKKAEVAIAPVELQVPAEAPHNELRAEAEAKAKEHAEFRDKKTAEADIVREGEHPKKAKGA